MDGKKHKDHYISKSILEPAAVIAARKAGGLHPKTPVPMGAIICYDNDLWSEVIAEPQLIPCEGWLKGAFVKPTNGRYVLAMKANGVGAPTAVMLLEELIAYGIYNFISLGAAGSLQPNLFVGDLVLCHSALRDEGTSNHYALYERFAHASPQLSVALGKELIKVGIGFAEGSSWTTDAPYRETVAELIQYRSEGILTVEMEAAALFTVANYRGVHIASVFSISDVLSESGWHQEYHSREKNEGLIEIFKSAYKTLISFES